MAASYAAPMALPVQWLKLEDGLVFEVPGGAVCADMREVLQLKGGVSDENIRAQDPNGGTVRADVRKPDVSI